MEKWAADEKTVSIFTAEEVFDRAVKGNVLIRRWGATLLLRSVPHIPCVRVCAPLEARVVRLRGIVVNDAEKALGTEVVSRLPGVKAVADDLRTIAGGLFGFPSQVKDKG